MKTVKVNVAELLIIILKNQQEHNDEYAEMMKEYAETVKDKSAELLKFNLAAKNNFKKSFNAPEPKNNSKDYERIISMLQMTVDTVIELDTQEYEQYVMNNWHWTREFSASKTVYGIGV